MAIKILLVEDENSVISFIKKGLTEEGYEVSVVFDGKSAISVTSKHSFDLILLDIMLPGINGLKVCKSIRKENSQVPILILTALGTAENVVVGLESGADDYLVKPFKFIELLARIKSLLRRTSPSHLPENQSPKFLFAPANIVLDDYSKTVKRGNKQILLTSTEYRLMLYFLKNPGRVLSRSNILEKVWGVNFEMSTNVVDVYVNYLRKKLESDGESRVIHTVVGMGYVLKEADADAN